MAEFSQQIFEIFMNMGMEQCFNLLILAYESAPDLLMGAIYYLLLCIIYWIVKITFRFSEGTSMAGWCSLLSNSLLPPVTEALQGPVDSLRISTKQLLRSLILDRFRGFLSMWDTALKCKCISPIKIGNWSNFMEMMNASLTFISCHHSHVQEANTEMEPADQVHEFLNSITSEHTLQQMRLLKGIFKKLENVEKQVVEIRILMNQAFQIEDME